MGVPAPLFATELPHAYIYKMIFKSWIANVQKFNYEQVYWLIHADRVMPNQIADKVQSSKHPYMWQSLKICNGSQRYV